MEDGVGPKTGVVTGAVVSEPGGKKKPVGCPELANDSKKQGSMQHNTMECACKVGWGCEGERNSNGWGRSSKGGAHTTSIPVVPWGWEIKEHD